MSVLVAIFLETTLLGFTAGGPGGGPSALQPSPAEPVAIVGGTETEPCQWPAAVATFIETEPFLWCTGSLVHPEIVMTAAHCVFADRPIVAVGFGEHGNITGVPEREVSVTECVANPEYDTGAGADVAFCRLAEAVHDVPIVPLIGGCEVEQIVPGAEVYIIGYGADYGALSRNSKSVETSGFGPKRWTTQTLDFIDERIQAVTMYGRNGSQSACFGDSGGPAVVQLHDGSWRVFGTGGHLYDPGGLPPPMEPGNICGAGVAYGYTPFALEWLEQASGFDLTPCWDGDVWSPGPACGSFPLEPGVGGGTWANGCADGLVGGGAPPRCADVPRPPDDTGGSDDVGDTEASTGGELTTGSDPTSGTPPPSTDDTGPMPPAPLPGDTGSSSGADSGDGQLDGDRLVDRGCACHSSRRGPVPWELGLVLLVLGWPRSR